MAVIPPPAAGRHLNIGTKFFLLFFGLALAGVGSWQVVNRTLTQMDGAATDINTYGSLRFLSQRIQVTVHDAAHGGGSDDAAQLERLIGDFEQNLQRLEARPLDSAADIDARHRLVAVAAGWTAYRDAARAMLRAPPAAAAHGPALRRLSVQSGALLEAANQATWALSDGVTRLQEKARDDIVRLALIDGLLLIAAFIYIRRRMALPVRALAVLTRRFAAGEHSVRSGFRSHDEIGGLAVAFDHMAAETETHIAQIAADLDAIRSQEASLRKLSQAVEHSPASVLITNAAGIIEYVNPAFVDITGYTPEEVVGQKPALLRSGQTLPETYREMWRTIATGGVWRGELLNRRKNGELFWENTQISPVRDAAGKISHYVAVKEDISARKHAEQALAMLNIELEHRVAARTRQLEAANRELQAFSHSVSHDLRTPLRAIQGFAEAIAEDAGERLGGEQRDYLQRIRAAAVRMGELIDELLELGRVGQFDLSSQPVNLTRMAREILAGLARAEPTRRVDIEVADDLMVDGDPRLLRLALAQLLGNAWKFSAGRDPARITFGHAGAPGSETLVIRDNGAGFDMAHADQLFRPFRRLHAADRFAGAGTGLALAKRVIELHGGRIWAEAAPEQGAAFYFELPEMPPEALPAARAGRRETQAAP
jgi:PAS domain S-box-containing protein